MKMPTSNLDEFQQQLNSPNTAFPIAEQAESVGEIVKIQKNIVISYYADSTGCGHIRNIFPMTYLNAQFGKTNRFSLLLSPVMILQNEVLMRTRSIFFQRTMAPGQIDAVRQYKALQQKYGYKMVYDIDDFIWKGDEEGECIPPYNFGGTTIGDDVRQAAIDIMNHMDLVCASTDFLGAYMKYKGVHVPIKTIHNTISQYFWGNLRKKPIKEKIKKPKVIYTGSPTHYENQKRLKGDWDSAWCEWIIKNVKDDKIEFMCMGGLPFFFEEIKNKIKLIQWVNSYQYHLPIRNFKPDFGIAPLVPNFFNYSKSDLKAAEYYSIGAAFIGTTFKGVKSPICWQGDRAPSPYDNVPLQLNYDCSIEDIDRLFWKYTEPELYNEVIKNQYDSLNNDGRWLESEKYIKMMTDIL